MRIFEVIESSTNPTIATNKTWYRNLYEPLVDLGHDVVLFPVDESRRWMHQKNSSARSKFSQKLWDIFYKEHQKSGFDLFFAYLMDGMIEPEVIDEIQKIGVPTCNFSCNNAHQFYLVEKISQYFDYNLHSERDAREKFLAIGATPVWWQMASNPTYFKSHKVDRTIDVSFVGGNYSLRARYLNTLLDHEIDAHAYGPGWRWGAQTRFRSQAKHYYFLFQALIARDPHMRTRASALLADHDYRCRLGDRFPDNVHDPVSDEELILLYSRSRISLGFLEVFDGHDSSQAVIRHLHLREFEAPMSGALYCTGYTEELEEFYVPDKEVIVYRNEEELVDKVKYYLAHPEEAERIREAGHYRAVNNHTYHKRFKTLFKKIGLSK